ncbi:phage tail protein [Pseudomonas sp. 11/12A]|uniref:phage tail protein n=1 Tax=Pseudomonas sp. 11/12A TaxID=1506582 RepID=UPI0009DDB983|nr:phage tail protein [Pseudomonas sp. 11/12A]
MSVAAASATATLTADEIVVETALGGLRYCLASFNKTINLATTGAGGMDTGTAPVNGFVGIYAIYNPTSGASALLAVNAASVVASVYGGANMPAGYSASALVGVWLTNGSGQFIVGYQSDRFTCYTTTTVLITSAVTGSITSLSIAAVVPPNAKYISGNTLISCSTASVIHLDIYPSTAAVGNKQNYSTTTAANGGNAVSFDRLQLLTPQTMGYYATSTAGTPSFQIAITGYEI